MTRTDLASLPAWPQRACRDVEDPDAFHVRDGEPWHEAKPRLTATARHYCRPCPIRVACRVAGRQRREWGVWGGLAYRRDGGGTSTVTDLLGGPSGTVPSESGRPGGDFLKPRNTSADNGDDT